MKRFMIIIGFLSLFVFPLLIFGQVNDSTTYYMPGEWEPHEAVWVGVDYRSGRDSVTAQIVKAIYENVQVRLNYTDNSRKNKFNAFLSSFEIDTTKLEWIRDEAPTNFPRDPGPLFLVNKKGEQKVIDFQDNSYGRTHLYKMRLTKYDKLIGQTDLRMAKQLNLPVVSTTLVAEGGGLETNGEGVLMSIEETALQRNPGKTLAEIEAEYLRVTHCKKMIWLKRMTLHDKFMPFVFYTNNWFSGGANGHIDEVARFVNPSTIVLAKIDEQERNNPFSKADYEILEEYYETLKQATDVNGNPFTIIRMPYPDLNVHAMPFVMDNKMRKSFGTKIKGPVNGDTVNYVPAVSYMNFMVTNGVVLIAKYWKKGMPLREKEKDEEVKKIMEKLYPDRKIVQINPYQINRGGGGIHCATQQQPRRI